MAIRGNLPKHLEVAARTAVLISPMRDDFQYRQIAAEIDLTASQTTLVDLGGMPVPTTNPKDVDTLIEKALTVEPEDWYLTLHISQNMLDDDQTGRLQAQFQNLNPAFQRHIDQRTFTILNAGDAQTYGACYDGNDFFDNDHVDKGAAYTTNQSNEGALALSLDNFNTAMVAARQFRDDQGNYTNFNYNLLVGHVTNEVLCANITGNSQAMDTANREMNPYAGRTRYFTRPELDSTAWYLVAANELTKPMIVAVRKRPQLLDMWFDAQAGDGGLHYFMFHGRYVHVYGDWRLAYQGNT